MEAAKKTDDLITSAAAFVEGGVQEACDDACSICLEVFSQSDPSTVTNCKHEFHLQCILEWCQRSSNCPMCWQPVSLRDATSQELLDAVEEERNLTSRLRNSPIFHHPSHVNFDLRHTLQLPVDASEVELEEHIFQHLAAAMGRGRHTFRREGQGNQSSTQGRQHPFFIFSTPNAPTNSDAGSESVAESLGSTSISHRNSSNDHVPAISSSRPQTHQASAHQQQLSSGTRSFASRSPLESQETGEQSDLQSFSESLRSRLNSWSMRYKDSLSRNTRGWKERLFSRSSSMADVGSEVPREVHPGIANVSRLIERLNVRENFGTGHATGSNNSGNRSSRNNLASD